MRLPSSLQQIAQVSLTNFIKMMASMWQNLAIVVNGNLTFGDGTQIDNINGAWINTIAPVAPNTDFIVSHNLNRIPVGYWVMLKDRACDVYTGSVPATLTQLTLRATVASAVLRIFVICALLGVVSTRSEAQGASHFNIAQVSTPAPSFSGIGGNILQPISGALITVCNGSTLPAPGATCTGLANIFSCITLSGCALQNPTSADQNGNYTFYATGGLPYVISVSGTNLTTYSYVWTAPPGPAGAGANAALSNLVGVSINTALTPQTSIDLGATATPFRFLYLYGLGAFGSTSLQFSSTPTANRTVFFPDTTDTVAELSFTQTLANKTFSLSSNILNNGVNTAGHYPRNNGTQYVDSPIQTADLPATATNCTGNNFAQGLNAGGTPICSPGGSGAVTLNKQDVTGTLTGNSADQTVYTYTMPGGTLTSGKCLDINFSAKQLAGATVSTMKVFFGATAVAAPGLADNANGTLFIFSVRVCNNTASTTNQWASSINTESFGSAAPPDSFSRVTVSTPTENTANPIIIKGTFNVVNTVTLAGEGWTVITEP